MISEFGVNGTVFLNLNTMVFDFKNIYKFNKIRSSQLNIIAIESSKLTLIVYFSNCPCSLIVYLP